MQQDSIRSSSGKELYRDSEEKETSWAPAVRAQVAQVRGTCLWTLWAAATSGPTSHS